MSEQFVIAHCSPTLAGIKTGNLFPVKVKKGADINEEIRSLNRILREKGLRVVPVKRRADSVLLYIYRPSFLEKDLQDPEALRILKKKGYSCKSTVNALAELMRHMAADEEFPHEVGLFLGYPPSDVQSFMDSSRKGVKCTGCWKAYSNKEGAEETFRKYKRCTEKYKLLYKKGSPLTELAVVTDTPAAIF